MKNALIIHQIHKLTHELEKKSYVYYIDSQKFEFFYVNLAME